MPRWGQNPKKIDLGPFKKLYKKYVVLDALKIDFGRILASKMEGLGGAKLLLWRSFFGLGRVLGLRWPQDPSRPLPRLIFLDFGAQLDGFWTPT